MKWVWQGIKWIGFIIVAAIMLLSIIGATAGSILTVLAYAIEGISYIIVGFYKIF